MPKVAIHVLGWNPAHQELDACLEAALQQDFDDFEVVYSDNGSVNGALCHAGEKFGSRPRFRALDNGSNLGFAGGHNAFLRATSAEFVVVLNPDAVLDRRFLTNVLRAFADPQVAAATGKMVCDSGRDRPTLDGTGMIINRARAAQERGQHEPDHAQYDAATSIFGVSGTAGVYRRNALEDAAAELGEYFDEDFFAYSEDLDLAWRLRLLGYKAVYVPDALVHHARVVRRTVGFRCNPWGFIRAHRTHGTRRRLGWRNHMFAILKNDFGWPFWTAAPLVIGRELAITGYMLLFETHKLGEARNLFALLPKMWRKRRIVQRRKRVSPGEAAQWFSRASG